MMQQPWQNAIPARAAAALRKPAMLLIALLFLHTTAMAQDRAITDSLRRVLDTAKDIRNRADALNAWAFEYRRGDADSGFRLAAAAYRLSSPIHYHKGLGDYYDVTGAIIFDTNPDSAIALLRKSLAEYRLAGNDQDMVLGLRDLSNAFIVNGDYDSALLYARNSIAIVRGNARISADAQKRSLMLLYESAGNIFYYLSYYDSSILYAQAALVLAEQTHNPGAQANDLVTIANVHGAQQNYDAAVRVLKNAEKLALTADDKDLYVLCLTNAANFLLESGNLALAKQSADSAISAGNKAGDIKRLAHNLMSLGEIEARQNRPAEALARYKAGLAACEKNPNPFIHGALCIDMGQAYLALGKAGGAEAAFRQSLPDISDDRESMLNCYRGLADAVAAQGRYRDAWKYSSLADGLKDSVFSDKNREIINELDIRYQTGKKQQEIERLALSNQLQTAKTKQRETERSMAWLSAGGIVLFGGIGFYRYRRLKRIEQERALLEDRLQIGRDLHDDLAASISGISLYGAAVKAKLEQQKTAEAARLVDQLCADAQEVAGTMGDALWLINPKNDTFEKLSDRMQNLARNLLGTQGIALHFRAAAQLQVLPLNIEARKNIYLIFKEAVNNTLKYAQATEVQVALETEALALILTVADNGAGLPANGSTGSLSGGNGLNNMRSRAAQIGGTLSIENRQEGGVKITLRCPLPKIGGAGARDSFVSLAVPKELR